MANNQTLGSVAAVNLCLWVLVFSFSWFPFLCSSSYDDDDPSSYNSFIISSFDYSKSKLDPFEWRYIRVDLPDWFSSMSLNIESDVDISDKRARKLPKSKLPIICFRDGSPPLPDASNNSINDLGDVAGPMQQPDCGSNVKSGMNKSQERLCIKCSPSSSRVDRFPFLWHPPWLSDLDP